MSTLYASSERRKITPSRELIALWNKKAPKPFSAPLNDIYIQALVFSNNEAGAKRQTLIHIGGDVISPFGPTVRDDICKEFNIPASCLFLSSTHNHMVPGLSSDTGPGGQAGGAPPAAGVAAAAPAGAPPAGAPAGGGGGFGVGEGAKEWTDMVTNSAKDAVRKAIATLRPARIGAGHGVSGISVNREWDTPVGSLGTGDRNGETLHEISVLRVDEVGGKPIAIMVNSNCHAGSFYGGSVGLDHRITGGDVAGLVSEFVGNAIGNGVVPIWAIGGAGDQNTYFHSGMMWPSVDDKGKFFKETYVMKDDDAIKLARNTAALQCMDALNVYKNILEFSTGFDLKTGIIYKTVPRVRVAGGPGGAPGAPGGAAAPAPGGQARAGAPAGAGGAPAGVPVGAPAVVAGGAGAGAAGGAGRGAQSNDTTFRFYLITLNGIAFAGSNSESFIGLKKAVRGVLQAYDEKFWIDMNSDARGSAGYVPSPRFDSNYGGGMRNSLQGSLLGNNGHDVIRAFADGFEELTTTIA